MIKQLDGKGNEQRESIAAIEPIAATNDPAVQNLIGGLFGPKIRRVAIIREGEPDNSPESLQRRHQEVIDAEVERGMR